MAKKTQYRAVFSNGQVKGRGSHRAYAAAWCASYLCLCLGMRHEEFGFSTSRGLAEKAARAALPAASDGRFSEHRVEIVPVVIA